MEEIKIKNKTEGVNRWGHIVCFGIIITFVAGIGHVNSFGLIYNEFIEDTHSTAKALNTAHGVFALMLALGGIILNSLFRSIPFYIGGLIGAVLFSIGSVATVFITNLNELTITFGVLQGLGFGVMVPVAYTTFNGYFVEKRTTVMSICKAVQGIILTFYPQLLKNIVSFYGFRGTLLIISGISLHTIPGMIIMRIQKIQKTKRITDQASFEDNHENDDLLECVNRQDEYTKRDEVKVKKRTSVIMHKLLKIINLEVLKDPVYCNICIGQSFVNFSDLTFFMLQPMLLFKYNYDQMQVATCISIGAGADVVGRFFLAILSSVLTINTRFLFYIATLLTFLIRLVALQVDDFLLMAIVTGCLGILRAWLHISSPLVISHHVTHKAFPGAYAMFILCSGVVNLTFGPLIGVIKDETKDYVPAFYALTGCCLPCLLFWPVEYVIQSKRSKRTITNC